jgi:hypothetical protein
MEVRNSQFAAFLDVFTPHTYICVVCPDSTVPTLLVNMNLVSMFKNSFYSLLTIGLCIKQAFLVLGRFINLPFSECPKIFLVKGAKKYDDWGPS